MRGGESSCFGPRKRTACWDSIRMRTLYRSNPYGIVFTAKTGTGLSNWCGRLSERKRTSKATIASFFRTVRQDTCRSEEHTSELQSRQYLVCRLLLEKKKKQLPHGGLHGITHFII